MFGKCGSLRFSEEVFHEFPQHQRDVVLWNSMLSAYSEQGHEEKAIQLYCELRRTCLNPDHTTYAITLSACAGLAKTEGADTYKSKLTCLEIGQRIHADARRDGLDSHAMVASSLGCLYGKCGVVRQAENSFISLGRHCNIVAWTTLITAYTEHGFEIKALQLYLQLYKEGMVPDQHVFSVVLQACVSLAEKEEEEFTLEAERVKFLPLVLGQSLHIDAAKKGFMSNMFIASMLVTLYSKCGTLVRAENVFRKICKPDLVLWTSMISACVEQGQVIKALEIFKQMQMLGVRLDSTAFASVLQACSEALRLDVCREVHFNTIASGYDSSRFLDNCLIHAYGACACSVDALAVFDSLVQPDIVSWNAPTAGYAREGNCEGCCQILENMLVTSNYPNKVTFSSILYACSHSGKVAQSMHFFETMNKDYGIAAELKHYAIIMDLFGRIGDFVKAKDISNKLPLDLNASLRSSLLGACLKHGNLELGEQLFDGSSEHEPQEYVFMSNLYVDTDFKDYGHQLI
ncbi:hypothetical protein KP509_11G034300 [Ceratopteris richardii]|nr:hypothetical protein KP509_11G034300 [Ceratopteris richardii]